MANVTNADLICGLRKIADLIEQNPDVNFANGDDEQVSFTFRLWYIHDSDEVRRSRLADFVRAIGECQKVWGEDWLWVRKQVARGVRIEASSQRETVCERVVTGKITVPATPSLVVPAKPEHEIDRVEWRCHPILETEKI